MDCPKCVGRLKRLEIAVFQSTAGQRHESGLHTMLQMDQCFICGGLWCDRTALEQYLAKRIGVVEHVPVDPQTSRELSKRSGTCPTCKTDLVKKDWGRFRKVGVEHCETCDGLWLDGAEIDRLQRATHPHPSPLQTVLRFFRPAKKT